MYYRVQLKRIPYTRYKGISLKIKIIMRTECKTEGCSNPLNKTKKAGARHVYCVACDRAANRERMRALRAKRTAEAAKEMYYRPKHGDIYVIYNPAFKGWVKVGCALDVKDRLSAFQTADPYRNYEVRYHVHVENKLQSETQAHDRLEKTFERKGEWFRARPWEVTRILKRMKWN